MEQTHNTSTGKKTHWPCWKMESELSLMPLFPWGRVYPVLPSCHHHFHHVFGRSHQPTQQHRGKTLVCLAPGEGGRGDEFHLGFHTYLESLMVLIHTWLQLTLNGWLQLMITESLSASGSGCSVAGTVSASRWIFVTYSPVYSGEPASTSVCSSLGHLLRVWEELPLPVRLLMQVSSHFRGATFPRL